MKILVVGSGGREHALVWKLIQSPKVDKVYCAPGNAGIGGVAELVDIQADDIQGLCNFAKESAIDLTVVGPEVPLVMGIVDRFEEEGLRIFGANRACAQLEGSKAFAKEFMIRHQIPTAKYMECTDIETARKALGIYGHPMVIKADGLAAGKGVVIAEGQEDAIRTLEEIMEAKVFGEAGNKVVIEEFLTGIEASVLCFVDGTTIKPMVSAQDYKKIFEEDKGPNTGGMGTYSPSHVYDSKLESLVKEQILLPIMEGFQRDGLKFKGILFIGLMLTENGPKVLEFNTRFGDPETQVILTRLETDLVEIMESILEDRLKEKEIQWCSQKTVCVVIAAGGYPDAYEKGTVIHGLDKIDDDVMVFHGGTKIHEGQVVTNGGRVLGVTARGNTVEEARERAYENVKKIHFEDMYFRKDIGKRPIL
ncbi:phosphoribosylamine--glycine ligase [Anaerosolibacter carboniphilus]|uniref:Phosphoribosylamine--glycine ligase n=1 Tax=Anaerosolibacter carboniphilus TaxID=1417629 RepID=A0A841L3T3_9FIRM|nr:phosphoribosylamine--glycine ligase [Anaerosolibacter carboniphilus]MBB6218830.1 phosphoribosylamine--glycine ligase [Anaerosolibacter carboniphilus]